MSEHEQPKGNVVELLLREPEIVAWLEDYRAGAGSVGGQAADARLTNRVAFGDPGPDDAPDDDEPAAA